MNIYESISKCMAEIGAVGKDSKNQMQGFMYRGIDAVMNAINPALVKNHVFVVPTVLEQTREERVNAKGTTLIYSLCKIRYTFYAEDGTSVSAEVIGEGMDSGDKATNKAMSIAFKYACFQVFCIPTEEMIDPDAECHTVQPKDAKPAAKEAKTEAKPAATEAKPEITPGADPRYIKVNESHINTVKKELERTGLDPNTILGWYKIKSFDEMCIAQFQHFMVNVKRCKDKA